MWDDKETSRLGKVKIATGDLKDVERKIASFVATSKKIKHELYNRDDKVHTFPAALATEIKTFTTGVKSVLSNKTAQTPEHNKQAIDRNAASQKLANKHEADAKARGVVNQTVKSKLIW
jgi:hypothetical protein